MRRGQSRPLPTSTNANSRLGGKRYAPIAELGHHLVLLGNFGDSLTWQGAEGAQEECRQALVMREEKLGFDPRRGEMPAQCCWGFVLQQ